MIDSCVQFGSINGRKKIKRNLSYLQPGKKNEGYITKTVSLSELKLAQSVLAANCPLDQVSSKFETYGGTAASICHGMTHLTSQFMSTQVMPSQIN